MAFDYDVVIIGSGPAGFSCAMQSSKFDKKVLIIEADEDNLGGTWLNEGTVPSKALREAAKLIHRFHSQFGDEKGRKPYERFRMEDLMSYKQPVLEIKNQKVKEYIIKNKVDTARGHGHIVDKNTIEVKDQLGNSTTYTTKNILISTGSRPKPPSNFEVDHTRVLDYTSILGLTHIPRRLVIVGGGIITVEYATIFASLGTRVTILNDGNELLPFLDEEIKSAVQNSLRKKNIQVFKNSKIRKVLRNDLRTCEEVRFTADGDKKVKVVETEHVLYIGGKVPNTDKIGLNNINVKTDSEGYIAVNDTFKSSEENIYAAGDVIGYPALASASFLQGRLASCAMFGTVEDQSSNEIPYGIYSLPEISGIGLTEEDAEKQGLDVTVGRAYYHNTTQADLNHQTEGILKLVFRTDNLQLVGVHIFGDHATDLVHVGQSVMATKGTIKYFIERVLNYPTYSEAYKIAAFNGLNRVHKTGVKYKSILDKG